METSETKTENVEEKKIETVTTSQVINSIDTNHFLSPLVKSIIQKENLQSTDISQIKGSGRDGRISKNDVLNYIQNKSFTTNNSSNTLNENKVS